jgi:hypothetical protein
MVRSDNDEGLVRISLPLKLITGIELGRFRSVFLILRWQKEKGRHKKEVYTQLRLQDVGRRSLDICFQVFCRVFTCTVTI